MADGNVSLRAAVEQVMRAHDRVDRWAGCPCGFDGADQAGHLAAELEAAARAGGCPRAT